MDYNEKEIALGIQYAHEAWEHHKENKSENYDAREAYLKYVYQVVQQQNLNLAIVETAYNTAWAIYSQCNRCKWIITVRPKEPVKVNEC